MTIEITVVRYFFLFLFRFLYEISPPILKIFLNHLGVFNFLDFILISFELLMASIGDILAAFLAGIMLDRKIVRLAIIIEIKIGPSGS